MSFVAVSWIQPTLTAEFTGVGVTRMLEAMREACPEARFYQASSSEMFGKVLEVPQTETTPFYPRSPYGVAKAYGHFITVNYRESYDLLRLLRDPLQPRVARAAAWSSSRARSPGTPRRSSTACATSCALGNLDAERDWGYAKDYVEAMCLMLQQDKPEDYVIATGQTNTVRECVQIAFDEAGLRRLGALRAARPGVPAPGRGRPAHRRPGEGQGRRSGWEPTTSFEELIRLMTRADLELLVALTLTDSIASLGDGQVVGSGQWPSPLFDTTTPLRPLRARIDAAIARVVDGAALHPRARGRARSRRSSPRTAARATRSASPTAPTR